MVGIEIEMPLLPHVILGNSEGSRYMERMRLMLVNTSQRGGAYLYWSGKEIGRPLSAVRCPLTACSCISDEIRTYLTLSSLSIDIILPPIVKYK